MKPNLGIEPEEAVKVFNMSYMELWARRMNEISWDAFDKIPEEFREELRSTLLSLTEAAVGCSRDAMLMVLHENNELVYQELKAWKSQK